MTRSRHARSIAFALAALAVSAAPALAGSEAKPAPGTADTPATAEAAV